MTCEAAKLYSLATPTYNSNKKDSEPKFDESKDANNPENFKNLDIEYE
ncbi:MAG: hypothetical protein R3Y50_06040 [Rikenellaceae bacterium]